MIKRSEITGNLAQDLANLIEDLAENGQIQHSKAVYKGHDTVPGSNASGQSHAFSTTASQLRRILEQAQG